MKITNLYVYPIKGLRGIELQQAQIGPRGVKYDRSFILYDARKPGGEVKAMQLAGHTKCALFEQQIAPGDDDEQPSVVVRYHRPPKDAQPEGSKEDDELVEATIKVPLEPDISSLKTVSVDLHGSPASAYRMGDPFDAWFSFWFGHPTILVCIGDARRAVLGTTMLPKQATASQTQEPPQNKGGGWTSSLASFVTGSSSSSQAQEPQPEKPWLTFTDVAPLLVTSESSLRDVSARLPANQPMSMYKFRPNVVVDGEGEAAWAEDFWAELSITAAAAGTQKKYRLMLTGNCGRCTSLNVDYETGKPAAGELGTVLKKLMKDRRVDPGIKWSPVFGRYAFVARGGGEDSEEEFITVSVGDEVEVTSRLAERTVWDWPGL
ncbi:hypothetical protein B0H63DRAFT_419037 [Podospora didyma]|uniref:MOSC domain-containing protein n=1 Tax=Podospora didyma TaxID=330526 RepID=A0AAE0KDN8_9PEZI|nr:hypothetical protein B0H63DRAFT_419037 [Podospora didyma]